MTRVAYVRVSTADQSVDAQLAELSAGGAEEFDRIFADVAVSGAKAARDRPQFAALLGWIREGDTLYVAAVDRLGRDAIDVQTTVRELIGKGVVVDIRGLGPIGRGAGELIVAVLAQVADLERQRIIERAEAGRQAARASLAATGKTHRGKLSLGRTPIVDPRIVNTWRRDNGASASETAKHFRISLATVKRHWREHPVGETRAVQERTAA